MDLLAYACHMFTILRNPMSYQHIVLPESGEKSASKTANYTSPDNPIPGYVEGDGIGPDITNASLRVWDAAIKKAYGDQRKVHWKRAHG